MKERRLFRTFEDPSFPILVKKFAPKRKMPVFTNIHWHPEVEFLLVESGEYLMYRDGEEMQLHEGEVCPVPPNEIHCIRSLGEQGVYYSIVFSLDLIAMTGRHFFQESFVQPLRQGKLQIPEKIGGSDPYYRSVWQALRQTVESRQKAEQFLGVMTACLAMMPYCTRNEKSGERRTEHQAVQHCIAYLNENYQHKVTLEELAEQVHLHPNYLCTIFHNDSGQTIFQYLTRIRLEKACELLRSGSSVTQVAEQCGFHNVSFFSRTFKATYGTTPKSFAKIYENTELVKKVVAK